MPFISDLSRPYHSEGEKYLRAIWTQIAENFKDYDERPVFQSMNKPRLTSTNKESRAA